MDLPERADIDVPSDLAAEPSDWPVHGLADDMRPALADALKHGPANPLLPGTDFLDRHDGRLRPHGGG